MPPAIEATTSLDTAGWDPGAYDVVLSAGRRRGDRPRFAAIYAIRRRASSSPTDRRTYAPGQPIEVSWTRAPANRWDWLAVFEASAP